ncbi:MAG: hypothetical protein FJX71_06115 [Alphaproteobacteria bacterium]|nr:hypothetical protein [Alphaproteobacteria bacterium]
MSKIKRTCIQFYMVLSLLLLLCPEITFGMENTKEEAKGGLSLVTLDENDDDDDTDPRYAHLHRQKNNNILDQNLDVLENNDSTSKLKVLDQSFDSTVLNVDHRRTLKQMAAGLCAVAVMVCCEQVFPPLFLTSFKVMTGLTSSDLLPSPYMIGFSALIPVIAGSVIAYNLMANLLTPKPSDIREAQRKVTSRPYTRSESFLNNPVIQYLPTLLWGGLAVSMFMNIESGLQGWNPLLWGSLFGGLYTFVAYYVFVHPTKDANNPMIRRYSSEAVKEKHEKILGVVTAAEIEIKDSGLTQKTTQLAKDMNVIFTDLVEDNDGETDPLIAPTLDHSEKGRSALGKEPIKSAPLLKSPTLKVFKDMMEIEENVPDNKKISAQRKETIAKWLSYAAQGLSLPIKSIITYGLSYQLFSLFVPSEWVITSSVVSATVLSPFVVIIPSYKSVERTKKVFLNVLNFFQQNSPPYWGARIAPVIAVGAAGAYGVLPIVFHLFHKFLESTAGISNTAVQVVLISPLLVGDIFTFTYQTFADALKHVSQWVATDMPVDFLCRFKIMRCVDSKERRSNGFILLGKVQEFKEKAKELNEEYINLWYDQLYSKDEQVEVLKG